MSAGPLALPAAIVAAQEEDLAALAACDARGLLVAPGESLAEYAARLGRLDAALAAVERDLTDSGSHELFPDFRLRREDRIPPEIMAEAGEDTERHYGFRLDWAPGFFLSRSLGLLWGGCAISFPDNGLSIFLVRAAFARRRRWLIYGRAELLAHELCHAARLPLGDREHEEWFAYRLSPSRLRRHLGNCFQADTDALLFLLPVLLLLAVQVAQVVGWLSRLPIWPFWMLALLGPAYLLMRNHLAHRRLQRARRVLAGVGAARPEAILFRCSGVEIRALAGLASRPREEVAVWRRAQADRELRWRMISHRFW